MNKLSIVFAPLFVGFFISLSGVACGTTVEWNLAQSLDTEVWDTGPLWQVGGTSEVKSNLYFDFFVTHDYFNYIASDKLHSFRSTWVTLATKGDIVSYETMQQSGQEYFYRWFSDASTFSSDYNIPIVWDETVYLAMSTITYNGYDPYVVYGWVELGMDGDAPVVKSSAWDVDGGAMYVGGGAVPEPSATMLLMLGVAGLSLRRHREGEACPRTRTRI